MVLKGVSFVCFLWIGAISALPSNNDDGFTATLERRFQTPNVDSLAGDHVPRFRKSALNSFPSFRQETADPTARMDLVKSIDDIIGSPYDGPYIQSLEALLHRRSLIKPTKDSTNLRQGSNLQKRFTSPHDKFTDNDQFSPPNSHSEFNFNKSPSSSVASLKDLSHPNFDTHGIRPKRPKEQNGHSFSNDFGHTLQYNDRKPYDYSSQTFGTDSQSHFETIHNNLNDPFKSVKSQPRPLLSDHSNLGRRQIIQPSHSDSARRPETIRSNSNPRIYEMPVSSYSQSQKYPRHENIRVPESFQKPRDYSSFERPFRPSPSLLSRRQIRNRRDLHSSQAITNFASEESQHFDQESKGFAVPVGRPANFPNFASIGGLRELQEGSEVASGSFNHEFKIPKVNIPDISVPQPLFRESFNFRKKNDTTDTKPIFSNGTNKTDSKIQERSVKKELNLKANLDDLLTEESAQIPFHRIFGRKDANPESYITHTRVPRQYIHYPVFDRRDPLFDRRERAESINSPFARENIFLNPRHFQQFEEEKAVNQRFFPNFPDGRFFGPAPLPQQAVQVGRVGHRGSHNQLSKQKPFRGSPEAFASHNSFNDFEPVDNSILGSGNFEVIKGGTFYDEDDPHLNHNPYDPYLDNSYVVFPTGNPPNSNHVDDFFQNFRDFSEFATRRSGSDHFDESPNDGYIASGFSENIPSISRAGDMMTSESKPGSLDNSTKGYEIIQTIKMQNNTKSINDSSSEFPNENIEKSTFLKPKQLKKHLYKIGKDNKTKSKKIIKISQERKRPKNIQEVLEQMDQSSQLSTSDDLEVDPLIAIF